MFLTGTTLAGDILKSVPHNKSRQNLLWLMPCEPNIARNKNILKTIL